MKAIFALMFAMAAAFASPDAPAQAPYPNRPVKIVVGFAAGGLNDVLARLIAQQLTPALGQAVLVENRPGAAANIATEYVARAEPDGHTLLLSSSALAINPGLNSKLPFDALRDLAPIIQITTTRMLVMVNPSVPAKSLGELLTLARDKPGSLLYGSAGPGSPIHLASEMLKRAAGVDIVHVPYKGSSQALVAATGGEVQVLVDVMPTALPLINAGKLRPLAVASTQRSSALPNVPTTAEAGLKEFVATSWNGVLAPAGTPPAVIERLHAEIARIMSSPEMRSKVLELGAEAEATSPKEFAAFLRTETDKWAAAIRIADIKSE